MKKQKVVMTNPDIPLSTNVLAGDADERRFNDLESQQSGKALPTLLAEGWQIVDVINAGNSVLHYLLEKEA